MASIKRRGERWFAQVSRAGQRPSKSFSTKAQAEKWARRTEIELEDGAFGDRAPASSKTMGELSRVFADWTVACAEYIFCLLRQTTLGRPIFIL